MNNKNNVLPDNSSINVIKATQSGIFTNYIYKAIPLAFDESMSYYETLCGLLDYLKNTVIPTVNNNADAVIELQNLYTELHDYVEHYFDNLDVQEEINNKLDEMSENGTLTYLIQIYIDPLFNEYKEEVNNQNNIFKNSINNTINSLLNSTNSNTNDINALSSRVDSFTHLAEGSTTGDAELIDIRTSNAGLIYPSAGDSIRSQSNLLQNQINVLKNNLLSENKFDGNYIQGLYKLSDGTFDSSRTDYISNRNKIYVNDFKKYLIEHIPNTITGIFVMYYKQDDTFISGHSYVFQSTDLYTIPDDTDYIRVSLTKGTGINTTPFEIESFILKFDYFINNTTKIIKDSLNIYGIQLYDFTNYIYNASLGSIYKVTNRIGITNQIILTKNIKIMVDNGYKYSYTKFSQYDIVPNIDNQIGNASPWSSNPTTLEKNDIFIINLAKTDDSIIYPEEYIHLHIIPLQENDNIGQDYSIDNVMNKKNINLTLQGAIAGYQSFCKYNNYLYCTDGEHIYVYNNNYVLQNTIDINVGHGNSMQLGENGICYISGWNDNKIHVINLNSMEKVNEIIIPDEITGYSTCCVDELNNIAYIFNAPINSSSSEVNYNFIKYDYANNKILSTKKLSKFGAMQACDYLDGNIIALNGLGGANGVVNHFRYYNTNGDITGEYIIDSYSSSEPEGVFIDRNTKDVYVGIGTQVYKINQ